MDDNSVDYYNAAASILASMYGYSAQEDTNDTNKEIARETNALNYKIWQENKQHNIDIFNMQNDANVRNWQNQFDQTNAYNTASAQRARLEEAGLNPMLMMNGGNAGVASSSGIPTANAQPAQAPTMRGYEYRSPMLSALDYGMNSLLSISESIYKSSSTAKVNQETRNLEQDEIYKRIQNRHADDNATYEKFRRFFEYKREEKAWENDMAMQDDIQLHLRAMRIGQELSNEQQKILNAGMSAQRQADLALTIAQEAEVLARKDLTRKQIEEASARISKMYWDSQLSRAMAGYYGSMTKLNNQTYQFNQDTNDLRIEGMSLDNTGKSLDNTGKRHDNTFKFLQNKFQKAVVQPMIENAISNLKLQTIQNQNAFDIESTIRGNYNTPVIGDILKGVGAAGTYINSNSPIKGVFGVGK